MPPERRPPHTFEVRTVHRRCVWAMVGRSRCHQTANGRSWLGATKTLDSFSCRLEPARRLALSTGSLVFSRFTGWAAFHPDRKSILFSATEPGHRVRVYRLNIEGGAPRAVSVGRGPAEFDFARRCVHARSNRGERRRRHHCDGRNRPEAASRCRSIAGVSYAPVYWSADGKSVLIEEARPPAKRIDRLDLSIREVDALARTSSPGGRVGSGGLEGIAFSANEDGWVAGYHRYFSQLVVVEGLK